MFEFNRNKIDEIITTNNGNLPDIVIDSIDCLLASEQHQYKNLEPLKNNGFLKYQGDIFDLKVDVIVNPVNEHGLGCFTVGHNCLDNQIHRRCGPRLREDCRKLLNGSILETSDVFATKAYHINSKYIFHALGPIYRSAEISKNQLVKTYQNCLSLLDNMDLNSIAFPEISTGIFGYPKDEARKIAIETLKNNNLVKSKKIYLVIYS